MGVAEDASRLWGMAQLGTPMCLRVVATLRIADRVAAGPRTCDELAEDAAVAASALDPVLRHLAFRGVFRRDRRGRYTTTALGELLRDDHPEGMRAVLDAGCAIGRGDLAYVELLDCVRTGGAGYPVRYGRGFWDDLADDEALSTTFYDQMRAQVVARADAVAEALDWERFGHLVDVGGGDGALMAALLARRPGLRGTVVDRAAAGARDTFAAAAVSDRADVEIGSFFDPLPAGAGGYLLSQVLHDWDDDSATAILRRCAEAAGPGGTVVVLERTGSDGEALHAGMDLRMLVYFGGRERGVGHYDELADRVGLRRASVTGLGEMSLMEYTART